MNLSRTLQASKESKYQIFLEWFLKNGGKFSNEEIIFPAIFEPGDFVGVAAANNLKKHKVILAVPQNIIITQQTVKNSQLKHILSKNDLFSDQEEPDTQFNILAIFVIYQKMKGKQSFYYPYLNSMDVAQTILNWSHQEIMNIKDPYLKQYAIQLKIQYEPLYESFFKFTINNKKYFPQKLSYELFINSYSIVMTRCFGWGLPQTMLIPFADFFNHNNNGIYHYMCNAKYEKCQQKSHEDYIMKNEYLDLSLLGVASPKQKNHELNERVKFIKSMRPQLLEEQIIENQKELLLQIQKVVLMQKPINTPLLMSSDQQDNDSEQQTILTQPNYLHLMKKQKPFVKSKEILKEKRFEKPELPINKQFQSYIKWRWWKHDDPESYFIIATSSSVKKHQQIYNSYGQRSNRFLLIWYGFTLHQNKYNSIPFRLWMWKGEDLKNKSLIFARAIGDDEWQEGISLGKQTFKIDMLTKQFRLKQSSLSQALISYLRFQMISNNQQFLNQYKTASTELKINYPGKLKFQLEVFKYMQTLIKQLSDIYEASSIQQDYQQLIKKDIKPKQLFTARMKISNKRILLIQNSIIGIVIQILNDLINNVNFKQAYLKIREQYENDKLFRNYDGPLFYRKKIIEYLRTLHPIL